MGMRTEGQGCILADDMFVARTPLCPTKGTDDFTDRGLGKTAQAITLIWTLLRMPRFSLLDPLSLQWVLCPFIR
jgi:SNF2 family DNA or RNA helicase